MKRFFVAVVCAGNLFAAGAAQAAPILATSTDGLLGLVAYDLASNPLAMAISGASNADAIDGALITSGPLAAFDTDTVHFSDLVDDAYSFDLDFTTSVFNGALWYVVANGLGIVSSDPALLPFVGPNVVQFSFLNFTPILDGNQIPIGILGTYALKFIVPQDATPIPEPATLGLVAMGLAAAVRRRRQQKKRI